MHAQTHDYLTFAMLDKPKKLCHCTFANCSVSINEKRNKAFWRKRKSSFVQHMRFNLTVTL